jgi:hypothetical protein
MKSKSIFFFFKFNSSFSCFVSNYCLYNITFILPKELNTIKSLCIFSDNINNDNENNNTKNNINTDQTHTNNNTTQHVDNNNIINNNNNNNNINNNNKNKNKNNNIKNNININNIPPDIRSTIFCTAVSHSNEEGWNKLWNFYLGSFTNPNEKEDMLKGLACSKEKAVLKVQWALLNVITDIVISQIL